MKYMTTKDVKYRCYDAKLIDRESKSLSIFGFDTEAYITGECFMYCTSENDVWKKEDFPHCLFSRKYQSANFVAYNLGYDEGAIIQFLPIENLQELRTKGKTTFGKYVVSCIPKKLLTIRKGKNTVKFYDMYNFYGGSLNYNSKKYLSKEKIDIATKSFTREYVNEHWDELAKYCIQDAILVKELGELIIHKFENFGVYPKRLYSTAYMSYTYFRQKTKYVTVKRFWDEDRKLLDYAMMSYNGGKFEVTEKGTGMLYEYDIVSAYPHEIANLQDITHARIVWDSKFQKDATYGFVNCILDIPFGLHSPIAYKQMNVNTYPIGRYNKVITKNEYEYFLQHNVIPKIIDAVWLFCDMKEFPYREEITRLVKFKQQYKSEGKDLDCHTVKIFLNSLYGKFCQIIKTPNGNIASTCWNPIYASVITANTRLKVTEYQQKYKEVIAVHTDSLTSRIPLPFEKSDTLGDFSSTVSGNGIMLGCGIYQIGEKTKFRGFESKIPLEQMIRVDTDSINIDTIRKYGWREVVFHGWETNLINRFCPDMKHLSCHFDQKRLWVDDYKTFNEVFQRNVESLPLFFDM
jgi:hypothetical protein